MLKLYNYTSLLVQCSTNIIILRCYVSDGKAIKLKNTERMLIFCRSRLAHCGPFLVSLFLFYYDYYSYLMKISY